MEPPNRRKDDSPGHFGPYPTFGDDLRARITHVPSGTFTDMQLGSGFGFAPSRQFTNSSPYLGLITTQVQAGDAFTIEFFEFLDDGEVSPHHSPDPDAIWNTIEFSFDDAIPSDFIAVAHGNTTGAPTWNRPDTLTGHVGDQRAEHAYHWYELSADTTGDYNFEIISAGLNFENVNTDNFDFDSYLHLFDADGFDPSDASYTGLIALDDNDGEGTLSRISTANGDAATLTAGETYHLIVNGKLNNQNGVDAGAYTLLVTGPDGASMALDLHTFADADFNEDETVDGTDFEWWSAGFGTTELADHNDGDANIDGDVDGADFLIWQRQFGGPPTVGSAAGVPEPASIASVAIAFAGLACFRRK